MQKTRIALLWHHHQPYYRDLRTGVFLMPWVRLHGTKDYYGMARMLEECGGAVKATINLVPSLVEQIEQYASGMAQDEHLTLSTLPPADLGPALRERVLDLFFMAHAERMIRPSPRYQELFEKRRPGRVAAINLIDEYSEAEIRDLQVWANLAWFHRTLLQGDEGLAELVAKDRDFTEEEKAFVLRRQQEVLAELLPMHRRLVDSGALEVTTSPYYHPILPLLADMNSARVAMPDTPLPARRIPLVEDAREHLRRAVAKLTEVMGAPPTGLWPSEGSVSPEMLPLVREAGFQWLASDRDVLVASIRDDADAEADLYRPWRLPTRAGELSIVFRDHRLSDLVGFDYQSMAEPDAARDLVGRLRDIAGRHRGDETLITLILDGENPWEYYAEGGVSFLRTLYRELGDAGDLETVRISEHLAANPPRRTIHRLHSGSWIHANFAIWIGHEEDVRAWDYLFRVREDLLRIEDLEGDRIPAQDLSSAWESLYVAEGSDWTWWYGDDHNSGQDEAFDELFRTHLKNVYHFLGRTPPGFLDRPVPGARGGQAEMPTGLLSVKVNGRRNSYFEWSAAGRYRAAPGEGLSSAGGAMHRAGEAVLTGLCFGFDLSTLFLRIDLAETWRDLVTGRAEESASLVVRFEAPAGAEIVVTTDEEGHSHAIARGDGIPGGPAEFAVDRIVELSCPFAYLGVEPGDSLSFHVELIYGDVLAERLPGTDTVSLAVPTEDYEALNWRV